MVRGFNRVILMGNLGRDPEVRYTVNKKAFARFSVAVNYTWKNANGETQEGTDFFNIVVWGVQAENCGKYLKKGRPVLIEGTLRTGSYEAKDGSGKRYTTDIMADRVIFLGSGQRDSSSSFDTSGFSAPIPSDEDFGKSINDSGFGGDSSSEDFFDSDKSSDNSNDEADIPF